jgi:hypothetical protein
MNAGRRELTPERLRRLTVDPDPWLSCDDCFALLDQYVEDALAGITTPAMLPMRAHLAGCYACRDEAESLLELAASDRGLAPDQVAHRLFG